MDVVVQDSAGHDRTVATILDVLRERVAELLVRGELPTGVVVAPRIYAEIARAKAAELERNGELFLLGFPLHAGGQAQATSEPPAPSVPLR